MPLAGSVGDRNPDRGVAGKTCIPVVAPCMPRVLHPPPAAGQEGPCRTCPHRASGVRTINLRRTGVSWVCGCGNWAIQRKYLMLSRKPSGFRLSRAMRRWGIPAALLLAGSLPLHAETLKEALTAAYLYNPALKAARAASRHR